MKPNVIFRKCKTDHTFLLKDYSLDLIILSTLFVLTSLFLNNTDVSLYFDSLVFIVALASIPVGWMVASLLHNTGHGNFKGPICNRFLGEIAGFLAGYGHYNFILVHFLHHIHSDHEHDPVNPKGMSFFTFLVAPTKYMIQHTKAYLREVHGHHKNYETILSAQTVLFYINLFLRQAILYTLLGPTFYIAFYLVCVASNIAILAHINYFCHQEKEDGSVEVLNLNHNLYYKAANFVTSGGYFHKNHHMNVNLIDPRVLEKVEKPLYTLKPINA